MDLLKPRAANSSPLTPLGFLERAATAYCESISIVYNGTTYTWSETHRRCLQLASSIASLDIGRGHVVSVVSPNIPAMYELQFAVPMAGAILNNINTHLDPTTISLLLQHSESKLIFVDYFSRTLVLEAISLFPSNTQCPILVLITDNVEKTSESIVDFFTTYETLVSRGDPGFKWVRPESEWDPMVLNYTSGTTSSPKGVVHCHRGAFIITVDSLIDWSMPKHPVYLWTLPIFHCNGWSFPWAIAAVGGTNVCLREFDVRVVYDLIPKHGVTHMCGAPAVLNMLSNSPHREPLQNPVQILTGGAPPPATVLFHMKKLGFVVSHGYGLTEVGGAIVSCVWKPQWNQLPETDIARLRARQGVRTIGMAEVDVLEPDSGVSVERDGLTQGEVVLRGGSTMLGYLKNPEGTSKCMGENGWFYTGDVGVVHQDGYLEIKDRSKDIIMINGMSVSSVEVESVLYSHVAVNEAAVVAQPDEFSGEAPCAFVSLKVGIGSYEKPTEKDIVEFCKARLSHSMVPSRVVFKEDLPKTSTGKIQKFILREIAKSIGFSITNTPT